MYANSSPGRYASPVMRSAFSANVIWGTSRSARASADRDVFIQGCPSAADAAGPVARAEMVPTARAVTATRPPARRALLDRGCFMVCDSFVNGMTDPRGAE